MAGRGLMDLSVLIYTHLAAIGAGGVIGLIASNRLRAGDEIFAERRLTEANKLISDLFTAIKAGVVRPRLLAMIRRYREAQAADAVPADYAEPIGDVPNIPVRSIGDRNV